MKLRKLIRELESIRGRHTELVSVYIPSGYNVIEMINQLQQEKSTASNIKSKATRKNVLSALEKIIQHLKLFRQAPPNGLVAFAGNVSPIEGREDIKLWSFEPPEKMDTKVYWCDQVFVLNPLKDLIEEKEIYGLIVLDAGGATVGLLKGKRVIQLKRIDSNVPSKTVKGGMSAGRYDRLRENAVIEFLNKVGEEASNILLQQPKLKGVLIGGPGPVKETFFKEDYLNYQIKNKVLGVKDIGYTDEYGLEELVNRSQDLLKEAAVAKERELLQKFFTELQKEGNVIYGYEETMRALDVGAVDLLLISEGFDWVRASLKCQNNHIEEKDLSKNVAKNQICGKCGQPFSVEKSEELIDILTEKALQHGTKFELVSTDTREGVQFKEIGGVGAMLRFKV